MTRSFSGRLVSSLIIVTAITSIIILAASYAVSAFVMMENVQSHNQSKLDYLCQQYNNSVESSENFLRMAAGSQLEKMIDGMQSDNGEVRQKTMQDLRSLLSIWLISEKAFSAIYIVTEDCVISFDGADLTELPIPDSSAPENIYGKTALLRRTVEAKYSIPAWNRALTAPVGEKALIAGLLKDTLLPLGSDALTLSVYDSNHALVYGADVPYTDVFEPITVYSSESYYSPAEPAPVPPTRTDSPLSAFLKRMGVDAALYHGGYYLVNAEYSYESGRTFLLLSSIGNGLSSLERPTLLLGVLALCLNALFFGIYGIASRFAVKRIMNLARIVSGARAADGLSVLDAFIGRIGSRANFRRNITACFLIPFFPLSVLVVLSFLLYTPLLMENAKEEMQSTIEQMASAIETRLSETEAISFRLACDRELGDSLAGYSKGKPFEESIIADVLRRNGALTSAIHHVGLYGVNGKQLYATDASTPAEIPKTLPDMTLPLYLFDQYADGTGQLWAPVCAGQQPGDSSAPVIGYIELGLNAVFDASSTDSASFPNGYQYIYDEKNWTLICTDLSTPYRKLAEGIAQGRLFHAGRLKAVNIPGTRESRYFYFAPINNGRWFFVYSFPSSYITKNNYNILFYNLLLIIVSLAVSTGMAWILAHQIIKRVMDLAYFCMDSKTGGQELSRQWEPDEIGMLAMSFRELLAKTRELMLQINRTQLDYYKLEHRKNELELITIQTKMNPHFLYNIFTSIHVLLVSGETALATRMLVAAGRFLRLSLMGGNYEVSLEKELEFLHSYIELEKMRYPDRFDAAITCNDRLLSAYPVPRLILQPLVENAILHAMPADGKLSVRIDVISTEEHVSIRVLDNGKGLSGLEASRLNEMLASDIETDHMGLVCIHQRVKIYYGEKYGLSIIDPPDTGWSTCVEIILPPHTKEGEAVV